MPTAVDKARGGHELRVASVWWAGAVLIYLSFVTLTWTQVAAGMLVAATAVWLSHQGLRAAGLTFPAALPHLWKLRRVAVTLGRELRAVAGGLLGLLLRRPVQGRYAAFRSDEHIDASVDAALTFEASLAPNTYVVAVLDRDEGQVVLTHQFVPQPGVRRSFPRYSR